MISETQKYLAKESFSLQKLNTIADDPISKEESKKQLRKVRRHLAEFQQRLYAHDRHAVLICLQGMDTSGKDSLIREVFKDFNVRGAQQHSFKVPTELELSHGYLWRHYIALPPKGAFGIFNRSHYENVLVTRVHPEYLMAEKLPEIDSPRDVDDHFWQMRFDQINNFEKELTQNGTIIFKFFLNMSKEEQKNRLLRRLEKDEKNWKFSPRDLEERKFWDDYMQAYEEAIGKTNKEKAPWFIIPADDKNRARLIVATILKENLDGLEHIQPPVLSDADTDQLTQFVNQLKQE
jgi:PPK2 family polyphosphate:nucleotide phosphotransferase